MASDSKIGPILGVYKSKKLGVASVIFGFGLVAAGQNLANPWIFIPALSAATAAACAYIFAQALVEMFGERVDEETAPPPAPKP
jgi:hypothetical protein